MTPQEKYYRTNRAAILVKMKSAYRANPEKFKAERRRYRLENKEKCAAQRHARYLANKAKVSAWHAEYRKNNADKVKERKAKYRASNKAKIAQKDIRYRTNNKNMLAAKRAAKLKSNPSFKAACHIRSMLCKAIERGGAKKSTRTTELLGCSIPDFMKFIEAKFSAGMSWGNHGEWHLDHIVPLAKFDLTIIENHKRANHHTNFQPLWWRDNLSKGAR